jgi:hypothetical protein
MTVETASDSQYILASHQFENGSVLEIIASSSINIIDALDAAVTLIEVLVDRKKAELMKAQNG